MKLTTFLAFAAGFEIVTSSPPPTSPQSPDVDLDLFATSLISTPPQSPEGEYDVVPSSPIPTDPQPNAGDKASVFWDPPDAYQKGRQLRRMKWEKTCKDALTREGCAFGMIHQGETKFIKPNGDKTTYVNVEGAPFVNMENSKQMRLFQDGSISYGWSTRDRKNILEAKRLKKHREPLLEGGPLGQKALVFWDPVDTYRHAPSKKLYWEQRCEQALIREGCGVGLIHQGEIKLTENGQTTSYMNVEGAPSKDMENSKRMRVFQDGSSTKGWSRRDRKSIRIAKYLLARKKKKKKQQLLEDKLEGQTALLSWDPAHAYQHQNQQRRRLSWERVCSQALIRAGCGVGIIHQGESKGIKPTGEKGTYIRVEGALSTGMEYAKKMRVFQDGSSQDVTTEGGWSKRDQSLMRDARRPRLPEHQRGEKHGMVEKPALLLEDMLDSSKHSISWDPPNPHDGHPPHLIEWYEKACHQALEKEGCNFGVIRQGQHRLSHPRPDGTEPLYMDVFAGNRNVPDDARYMRLFENGSYQWYLRGEVPKKNMKRKKTERTRTTAKRRNTAASTGSPTPTQEPFQPPALAANREYQDQENQAHTLMAAPTPPGQL